MRLRRSWLAVTAASLVAGGCGSKASGGGGGGGGGSGATTGIALPAEISALPTKSAGSASLRAAAPRQALAADAGTDYAKAQTVKYVDERALRQFDILNTIFGALGQTHYADAGNVNAGPYTAMITWSDGDKNAKTVVPWVVDSKMSTENGQPVNVVDVWFPQSGGDGFQGVIKIRMRIYSAPTQKADGSYSDYGVWRIDAQFDGTNHYFVASAERASDGSSVVKVTEAGDHDGGLPMRGVLNKSSDHGYGKVEYPDCAPSSNCQQRVLVDAVYAYDGSQAAVQVGSDPVKFKDRLAFVDLVNRYGLFDAATGEDVAKSRSFGFPLRWTDSQGHERYAYYGAWQGRHQIWADGQSGLPEGTSVTRGDLDGASNGTPETFTVSKQYVGSLVKRTLVDASVDDMKDLVAQTWMNDNVELTWDGSHWQACYDPSYGGMGPPTCSSQGVFTDFASLAMQPGSQRMVNINGWDNVRMQPVQYVYVTQAPAGFYVAAPSMPPALPTSTGVLYTPSVNDHLHVSIGGPVYLSWDGARWVEKTLTSSPNQWPQQFAAGGTEYPLALNREYYLNGPNGTNYVVNQPSAGVYAVKVELQSVPNPKTYADFVPAGTTFKPQWCNSGCSTYRFDANPASATFLSLVFEQPGQQDAGKQPGDLVTQGQWGLAAYDANGVATGVQFNWDYPQGDGNGFGAQQYLKRQGEFVVLQDPIRLRPIELVNGAGQAKTLALQFDGNWVQGLPDVWQDLQMNGYDITDAIAAKVVSIPAGTEVVDANDGTHYLFKPLQIQQYLRPVAAASNLSLTAAAAIDLATVPTLVPPGLGDMPKVPVKYSEGKPVP